MTILTTKVVKVDGEYGVYFPKWFVKKENLKERQKLTINIIAVEH